MSVSIGTKVFRNGLEGVIVKIITKSTGYVEVDFNGKLKKEMAFNLIDENGVSLKKQPKPSKPSETNGRYIAEMKKDLNDAKYSTGRYTNQ